ncbi:uncharacterized protein BDZ99DRAFT_469595 [Mytilinidion resinicola]|uniref:Uncharacterized protein n=1 Tax=Mytilinidion resinicola TaxID=574789 RepID=A0A6A6XYG3_9PEZI|nr:uncharacterized protein BDZ99DRAFT_469595 [Mytilinidion resinicola]KAF2801606.1 hypothetical protein BDZ99DRAFT_469595 [Mytilinidion resinicola]
MQRDEYVQGDYPQYLKDAVEAAGRNVSQQQASATNAPTRNSPMFVVMHEERYVYSSDCNENKIIGVFATVEVANSKIMEFFKKGHPDVVEEDNFVQGAEDPGLNQVTWGIDELGAVSLEYTDGGDGDFFRVDIKKQVLQN